MRPRNDQKENELIISILRNMYEEKQKNHVHIGEAKQTSQPSAENAVMKCPAVLLKLLDTEASRSTDPLELSRGPLALLPRLDDILGDSRYSCEWPLLRKHVILPVGTMITLSWENFHPDLLWNQCVKMAPLVQ